MRYYLIVLLCFFSSKFFAQETMSFAYADSASYAYFISNDYKNIKHLTKKALHQGVDFYYLRSRAGIVAYNHKDYEFASSHLKVAYEMSPTDSILQEYLYYAYLFSGRTEDANSLVTTLTPTMQQRVGYKKKVIDNIVLTGGVFSNNNIASNDHANLLTKPQNKAQANYYGTAIGTTAVVENTFGNRLHFYNKFTYFNTNTYAINQFASLNVNMEENKKLRWDKEAVNKQLQYTTGFSYQGKKGLLVGIGVGYFQTKSNSFSATLKESTNTAFLIHDSLEVEFNDFSTSFSIGKRFKYIFPQATLTYSNLYDSTQLQGEFNLTYFPLGNMKFFGSSSISVINDGVNNHTIFSQKLAYVFSKYFWLEGKYSVGNHMNYISSLGFTTYNTPDPVKLNAGCDVHFTFKHLELIGSYSFQMREGTIVRYDMNGPKTSTNKYSNNNLIIALKWNF